MSEFYDRDGEPISRERWILLFEDERYQVVKQTEIAGTTVSTVWLGLDHGFGHSEKPLIFETMLFGEGGFNEERYRYASEVEALAHHLVLVEQARLIERAKLDRAGQPH